MKREDILRRPSYWFEHEQNELYRQVVAYMERENINRTELANRLNVHKSYVSQILNGNFNYTLKKWIELCLAIGVVPGGYKKIEDILQEDAIFAQEKKDTSGKKTEIQPKLEVVHFQPYSIPPELNGYLDNDTAQVKNKTHITLSDPLTKFELNYG